MSRPRPDGNNPRAAKRFAGAIKTNVVDAYGARPALATSGCPSPNQFRLYVPHCRLNKLRTQTKNQL